MSAEQAGVRKSGRGFGKNWNLELDGSTRRNNVGAHADMGGGFGV